MVDIVPEILEKILKDFNEALPKMALENYADANAYAQAVGETMSRCLRKHITKDMLPDGKMYFNIADRIMNGSLGRDFDVLADAVVTVQNAINAELGIGLKAVRPKLNNDRIKGLIERLTKGEDFDSVSWLLGDPVVNFSRAVVDDGVKANFELQGKAGLEPKIVRTTDGKCCKWCSDKAGTYEYPCPREIYQRHENCGCNVEFHSGGKRQNVWTKQFV